MSHLIGKIKSKYPGTDATFKMCHNAGGVSVVFTFDNQKVVDAIKNEGYEIFEHKSAAPLTSDITTDPD